MENLKPSKAPQPAAGKDEMDERKNREKVPAL